MTGMRHSGEGICIRIISSLQYSRQYLTKPVGSIVEWRSGVGWGLWVACAYVSVCVCLEPGGGGGGMIYFSTFDFSVGFDFFVCGQSS